MNILTKINDNSVNFIFSNNIIDDYYNYGIFIFKIVIIKLINWFIKIFYIFDLSSFRTFIHNYIVVKF